MTEENEQHEPQKKNQTTHAKIPKPKKKNDEVAPLMLNRSVNAKMTGSVLLEKKHRKSELLLFNPRASFIKGKHS